MNTPFPSANLNAGMNSGIYRGHFDDNPHDVDPVLHYDVYVEGVQITADNYSVHNGILTINLESVEPPLDVRRVTIYQRDRRFPELYRKEVRAIQNATTTIHFAVQSVLEMGRENDQYMMREAGCLDEDAVEISGRAARGQEVEEKAQDFEL